MKRLCSSSARSCPTSASAGIRMEEGPRWLAAVQRAPAFRVFNVPVSIVDPGPEATRPQPPTTGPISGDSTWTHHSRVQPVPKCAGYEGTYKTLEFAANKRYSNRWSMNASFAYTWTEEYGTSTNNRFGIWFTRAFSFLEVTRPIRTNKHSTSTPTGTPSSPERLTRAGGFESPRLEGGSGAP